MGVDATYDITDRVDGEEQPQLEVSPITMYVTEYAERYVIDRSFGAENQQSGTSSRCNPSPSPAPLLRS